MKQSPLAEPHHKQVSEFVYTQDLYNTFSCRSVLGNEQHSTQRLRRAFICIPCCPETPRTPALSDTYRQRPVSSWQHAATGPASKRSHSERINRINNSHFHIHTFMPCFRFLVLPGLLSRIMFARTIYHSEIMAELLSTSSWRWPHIALNLLP